MSECLPLDYPASITKDLSYLSALVSFICNTHILVDNRFDFDDVCCFGSHLAISCGCACSNLKIFSKTQQNLFYRRSLKDKNARLC